MRSPSSSESRRGRDAEAELNLPPGFRFHPTDEELVVHYLCRKAAAGGENWGGAASPPKIIAEVDLYKHDPWDLPEKALFGTKEWYFFTPRDKKYPNGMRPNRSAGCGYWKATGADKPIRPKSSPNKTVGIKKALVFYSGKAPNGIKTNWIMHEYRLPQRSASASSCRLDEWVLCRLYNKKNNVNEKIIPYDHQSPSGEHHSRDHSCESEVYSHHSVTVQGHDHHSSDDSDTKSWTNTLSPPESEVCNGQVSTSVNDGLHLGDLMQDDICSNEWFTNMTLEDLQCSLAEMPPILPFFNDF